MIIEIHHEIKPKEYVGPEISITIKRKSNISFAEAEIIRSRIFEILEEEGHETEWEVQ